MNLNGFIWLNGLIKSKWLNLINLITLNGLVTGKVCNSVHYYSLRVKINGCLANCWRSFKRILYYGIDTLSYFQFLNL